MIKALRVLLRSFLLPVCCVGLALFSGCATPPPAEVKTEIPLPTATTLPVPAKTAPPLAAVTSAVSPSVITPAPAVTVAPTAIVPKARATIKGSQEVSLLFDNYTAFICAVDGNKIAAGRDGWSLQLPIEAGRRIIEVEFNRGVFVARATLELQAAAGGQYELKYTTDAELFGQNSYCNFWIVDLGTGQSVTAVKKASVEKAVQVLRQTSLP